MDKDVKKAIIRFTLYLIGVGVGRLLTVVAIRHNLRSKGIDPDYPFAVPSN